ncbi:MAG: glycine cleavage T C-terminal barrel domain-containing protein, partial [Bradyrhizobium sp.]
MPLLVKICGLSTRETLDVALEGGADMVGFVFFPPSPRHISLETARELGKQAKGRAVKVALTVDAEDADPWGYNGIYADGKRIGMTSSGGYGHRLGKSIGLGYVPPEYAAPGTTLDMEILGKMCKAEVVAMPL